ncbi:MAG: hypothetical protein KIT74_09555 [Fimbriimonadales bacterium]|nr:hypothetical protein [Fimbriimonadales bacterium]
MEQRYSPPMPVKKGMPSWLIILIVVGVVLILGLVALVGFAFYQVASEIFRYEEIRRVAADAQRKYIDNIDISPGKPFSGNDNIAGMGNALHEMFYKSQLAFRDFYDETDKIDWTIDEQYDCLKDQKSYEQTKNSLSKLSEPYKRWVDRLGEIVTEYSHRAYSAAQSDSSGMRVVSEFVHYMDYQLELSKSELDVIESLKKSRIERLDFLWQNRAMFQADKDGYIEPRSNASSAVRNRIKSLDQEIARLYMRIDEIVGTSSN